MTPPDPTGPPGKFEITRAELVWPGKYDAEGRRRETPRIDLPFQVIERVNESRADRKHRTGRQQSLFDFYEGKEGETFEDGWRNKLIWGDNLLVTASLLEEFAGKIDLIYIDPPFATGMDFLFKIQVGDSKASLDNKESASLASSLQEKAYRDTWRGGIDGYLAFMVPRLQVIRDLLSDAGSLFLHVGVQVNHYLRVAIEQIFGAHNVLDEIIWSYGTPSGGRAAGDKLVKAHEYIIYATKDRDHRKFHKTHLPYSEKYLRERFNQTDEQGRIYQTRKRPGGVIERQYLEDSKGVPLSTVWTDIKQTYAMHLAKRAKEETGFQTQKPERLLDRIIELSTDPGDLVADFFCGSGTTVASAERLGRRWIACDIGRWGVHVTRKRLLGIKDCKPFEVLNLGKYERQYWQGAVFGPARGGKEEEGAIYEYLAFMLKLYRAQPVAGMRHIHGRKASAMVHVGAVDAPVTFAEVEQALDECERVAQKELHILGWEWEMGLAGPNEDQGKGGLIQAEARRRGLRLKLLRIPREVMDPQVTKMDTVRFFELAWLDARVSRDDDGGVRVELLDFAVPHPEELPDTARALVSKWSDWIDYWAVDWDFRADTFMQGWVDYRTRTERPLRLVSDDHRYEKPGKYRVLVKVVDIFGNDTSQVLEIEVP